MADYIPREAVLDLAYWHGEKATVDNPNPDGVDAVDVSDIEAIPTADVVEVVHGEWVFKSAGPYKQTRSYCSACGRHSGIGGIQKNQEKPFCPNCGAKMDGREK